MLVTAALASNACLYTTNGEDPAKDAESDADTRWKPFGARGEQAVQRGPLTFAVRYSPQIRACAALTSGVVLRDARY